MLGETTNKLMPVERSGFAARDADCTNRDPFTQHRHDKHAAPADRPRQFLDALGEVRRIDIGVDSKLSSPRYPGVNPLRGKRIWQHEQKG